MKTVWIIGLLLIVIVLVWPSGAQVRKDATVYGKGVTASGNVGQVEETDSCAWALEKAKQYAMRSETSWGRPAPQIEGARSIAFSEYYRACKGR